MKAAPPIEQLFDLGRLSQAEQSVTIAPDVDARARIASWTDVVAVPSLTAEVTLHKISASQFSAAYRLSADIVQNCVATLEPMTTHIARDFTRLLHFAAAPYRAGPASEPLDLAAEDGPEEIESLRYDLALPLLEELVLAIDPYPRKPGVAFQPPGEAEDAPDRPESPFAVLKSLKTPP
jgi:uncharacterized metal-binding protein YceD (DUF177 family)